MAAEDTAQAVVVGFDAVRFQTDAAEIFFGIGQGSVKIFVHGRYLLIYAI